MKRIPSVRKPIEKQRAGDLEYAVDPPHCTLARLRAGMPTLVGAPKTRQPGSHAVSAEFNIGNRAVSCAGGGRENDLQPSM